MKKNTLWISQSAVIAALYILLTLVAAPLSFGQVQVRIAEALCVLPYFTPAAVPGLFVGCLLANLLGGAPVWDVLFGSLATLLGALGTHFLSAGLAKRKPGAAIKWLAGLPAVISNTLILPLIFRYVYAIRLPFFVLALPVLGGELIAAWILGTLLLFILNRYRRFLFPEQD